jgi:hypothetical protein
VIADCPFGGAGGGRAAVWVRSSSDNAVADASRRQVKCISPDWLDTRKYSVELVDLHLELNDNSSSQGIGILNKEWQKYDPELQTYQLGVLCDAKPQQLRLGLYVADTAEAANYYLVPH